MRRQWDCFAVVWALPVGMRPLLQKKSSWTQVILFYPLFLALLGELEQRPSSASACLSDVVG